LIWRVIFNTLWRRGFRKEDFIPKGRGLKGFGATFRNWGNLTSEFRGFH